MLTRAVPLVPHGRRAAVILCAAVFLLAFAVRLTLTYLSRSYLSPEYSECVRIAVSLADHGTFAGAYGPGTGPTAHTAPLYPLLLSLVYRAFGTPPTGALAQEVFSCLLASLQYALLPLVALACRMPLSVGASAGILAALFPVNRWVQTRGAFEYSLSALMVALLSLAVLSVWRDQDYRPRRAVLIGLVTGLTLLTAPQVAPVVAVLIFVPYLVFSAARSSRYSIFVVAQLALVFACLAPWITRNYLVLGAPVWGRSNLGFELYLSNNDKARAEWDDNMASGLFQEIHPSVNLTERARITAVGEVAYNQEKAAAAMQWIAAHKAHFVALTLHRAWHFWFPTMKRPLQSLALALITVAGLLGMVMFVWRRRDYAAWFFLTFWIVFPLPCYLFQQSSRMRYSFEWMMFLLGAYLLHAGLTPANLLFQGLLLRVGRTRAV